MDPSLYYMRAGIALIAVLSLIGVIAALFRRFALGGGGQRGWADKRLEIVETLHLDAKRRVIVLRFDRAEHVVLLGSQTETVLSPRARIDAKPARTDIAREPAEEPSGGTRPEPSFRAARRAAREAADGEKRREPRLGDIPLPSPKARL